MDPNGVKTGVALNSTFQQSLLLLGQNEPDASLWTWRLLGDQLAEFLAKGQHG